MAVSVLRFWFKEEWEFVYKYNHKKEKKKTVFPSIRAYILVCCCCLLGFWFWFWFWFGVCPPDMEDVGRREREREREIYSPYNMNAAKADGRIKTIHLYGHKGGFAASVCRMTHSYVYVSHPQHMYYGGVVHHLDRKSPNNRNYSYMYCFYVTTGIFSLFLPFPIWRETK